MGKILGLDLGSNSIGWAVIEDELKQIIGTGVRIFPKGVNEEKGNEVSKNEDRRLARGLRRQIFRRKLRKQLLLNFLIEYHLCPITHKDVNYWKTRGQFPDRGEIKEWFSLNPYELRAKALTKKLSKEELGRVFYHLSKRRGFLSNRKSASREDGAIEKGDPKTGKVGINETAAKLEEFETLGAYLNSLNPHKERIRNRYTTRRMYVEEFLLIWDRQSPHHSWMNETLKTQLCDGVFNEAQIPKEGILFFQRPLRSQKHTLGSCGLIANKPKAKVSTLAFEEYRAWSFINQIECNNQFLESTEKERVWELIKSKSKAFKFKDVRKRLKRTESYYHFNYADDDQIPNAPTHYWLAKIVGEKWSTMSEKLKNDLWHVLTTAEDVSWLRAHLTDSDKPWQFSDDQVNTAFKAKFEDGYASYSLKAINLILPYLKKGYNLYQAKLLAGVEYAFGNEWSLIDQDDRETIEDTIIGFSYAEEGTVIQQVRMFLKEAYSLKEKQLQRLFYNQDVASERKLLEKLPEPQSIRNPLVSTALHEVRRVVNALIERFGPFDTIRVEMARDLKQTADQRKQARIEQKKKESYNLKLKNELESFGIRATHINFTKYKLFKELKKPCCPFTGKQIHLTHSETGDGLSLFSNQIQIEHIHPWSRSLNDSFNNKTLCARETNLAKGDRLPSEYFRAMGETAWDDAKTRALTILPYRKFKHFTAEKIDEDFVSRQLNDTRYISKVALSELKNICKDVSVSPGRLTSQLRHLWGLNSILNPEHDSKTREDNRHHAVDALVVACTNRSILQHLSKNNRYHKEMSIERFPKPWEYFREDVENSINSILVSHRRVDRVLTKRIVKTEKIRQVNGKKVKQKFENLGIGARGALHKETVYGKRRLPGHNHDTFHVRKPLESISNKTQLDKVVDSKIRKLLYRHLENELGIDTTKKEFNIPTGAFFHQKEDGSLNPRIFLENRKGESIPIKKVRVYEQLGNAVALKAERNQWVNPRNNHHIAIYKDAGGKLYEEVVNLWTAVERAAQGLPLIDKGMTPDRNLVVSFSKNELFLIDLKMGDNTKFEDLSNTELMPYLYRVQKISSRDYVFRHVNESTETSKKEPYMVRIQSFKKWTQRNPIKVRVSPDGQIKRA